MDPNHNQLFPSPQPTTTSTFGTTDALVAQNTQTQNSTKPRRRHTTTPYAFSISGMSTKALKLLGVFEDIKQIRGGSKNKASQLLGMKPGKQDITNVQLTCLQNLRGVQLISFQEFKKLRLEVNKGDPNHLVAAIILRLTNQRREKKRSSVPTLLPPTKLTLNPTKSAPVPSPSTTATSAKEHKRTRSGSLTDYELSELGLLSVDDSTMQDDSSTTLNNSKKETNTRGSDLTSVVDTLQLHYPEQ